MAFQFVNYAALPAQGVPVARDLVSSLLEGYKAARTPIAIGQQEKKGDLANALAQLQLEQEPERFRSQMDTQSLLNALRGTTIERNRRELSDPFLGKIASGSIGQSMWLDRIKKQYGEDSPEYMQAKEAFEAEKGYKKATQERNEALTNSIAFRGLPSAEKNRAISTAIGMGFDPQEAAQRLSGGQTLQELAQEKNVDLQNVTPIFPLSGETVKQMQNRSAFSSEIKSLEENTAQHLNKYGRRFAGYSPQQAIDLLRNKDPEEQGKVLAARALQPELAALRLKAAGGNVGIEAIREMQHSALSNLNVFEPLISSEARDSMNRNISKWIDEAVKTYNNTLLKGSSLGRGTERDVSERRPARLKFNPQTGGFE